jgi:hypothetical protein
MEARMAGRRIFLGCLLTAMLGVPTFWACGGGGTDRDTRVCRSCDPDVARGCFNECRELCVAGDPNCDDRCSAQCDECRRDLVCSVCRGDCTGSKLRCAPQNETVECDDGTYGGSS